MRAWIATTAAVASVTGLVPLMHHRATASDASQRSGGVVAGFAAAADSVVPAPITSSRMAAPAGSTAASSVGSAAPSASALPPLAGVDLTKIVLHEDGATAPAPLGRVAHLTLNPQLQRATQRVLRDFALPEAAVVVLDLSE